MNAGESRTRTPIHLWIVGVLSLLWHAMGTMDFTITNLKVESFMNQFTEKQLAYYYGFPAWVTFFWAIAVWGALLGSIGLLLRKKWSMWVFAVSAVSMVFTTIYNFGMTNGLEIMGTMGIVMSALVWSIALFLLWYSWWMAKKGVLT